MVKVPLQVSDIDLLNCSMKIIYNNYLKFNFIMSNVFLSFKVLAGVVGGLLLLILVTIVVIYILIRKKEKELKNKKEPIGRMNF